MSVRIIPRLDIKGPNLVKGIHLEGLRVLGKPEHFARFYYEHGADELFYMDAVASLYNRNSLNDIIRRTAEEISIPLTVGGGIRTVDDIRTVLRCGADKVAINTAAIGRPEMITEAAETFGSSTILVSIETIRQPSGAHHAYTESGRTPSGRDAYEWALEAVDRGAGELVITSVDREGTGQGFDVELVRRISRAVSVPVIACGGAGSVEHVRDVVTSGCADAVCLASCLHYEFIKTYDALSEDYLAEGNTEFLKKARGFSKVKEFSLPALKQYLSGCGIDCRYLQIS